MSNHPRLPKYWELAEQLKAQIDQAVLQPGSRVPSLAEMQEQYSVSRGTVEKAFGLLEQEGLIVREQGRGTFVAELKPRESTGLIGYVGRGRHSRTNVGSYNVITEGIEDVAHKSNRQVVLLNGHSSLGWEKVDGIIIKVPAAAESVAAHLPPGIPCVSFFTAVEGISSVVADDAGGARYAVEHLVELGHQRIACLMETVAPQPKLRREGFREALKAAHIEVRPEWMRAPRHEFDIEKGYREWARLNMQDWLQNGWFEMGCTAILAQNDMAAIGVIEVLQAAGVSVPNDISVVGFDSTDICEHVTPSITSIEIPLHRLATVGTELLIKHIKQGRWTPEALMMPTRLQVRQSTTYPTAARLLKKSPRAVLGPGRRAAPITLRSSVLSMIEGV
jgi:DNA-binding LacI/PurR family transcriptional regulator